MAKRKKHRVVWRKSQVKYRRKAFFSGAFKWGLAAVVLAGLFWGGARVYALWQGTTFCPIAVVEVSPPLLASVQKRPGLKAGGPMWGFSARSLKRSLIQENPAVGGIDVRRTFSRHVLITGAPRVALARFFEKDVWRGIDAEGARFPLPADAAPESLVLVDGKVDGAHAAAAVKFFAKLKSFRGAWTDQVQAISLPSPGEWIFVLKNGAEVHWGNPDDEASLVATKTERLDEVLRHQMLSGGIKSVQFVSEDRIVVQPLGPLKGATSNRDPMHTQRIEGDKSGQT